MMTKGTLKRAQPDALLRLARYLNLKVDGMSHAQIAGLVRWLLSRRRV